MSLLKRKVQAYPAPAATSSPVKLTEKDLVPIAEFATHIKTGRLSSGLKPWLASHPNFLSDYYEARLQQAIPYFFNSGNAAQGRSYAHGSPPHPPLAPFQLHQQPTLAPLTSFLCSFHHFQEPARAWRRHLHSKTWHRHCVHRAAQQTGAQLSRARPNRMHSTLIRSLAG